MHSQSRQEVQSQSFSARASPAHRAQQPELGQQDGRSVIEGDVVHSQEYVPRRQEQQEQQQRQAETASPHRHRPTEHFGPAQQGSVPSGSVTAASLTSDAIPAQTLHPSHEQLEAVEDPSQRELDEQLAAFLRENISIPKDEAQQLQNYLTALEQQAHDQANRAQRYRLAAMASAAEGEQLRLQVAQLQEAAVLQQQEIADSLQHTAELMLDRDMLALQLTELDQTAQNHASLSDLQQQQQLLIQQQQQLHQQLLQQAQQQQAQQQQAQQQAQQQQAQQQAQQRQAQQQIPQPVVLSHENMGSAQHSRTAHPSHSVTLSRTLPNGINALPPVATLSQSRIDHQHGLPQSSPVRARPVSSSSIYTASVRDTAPQQATPLMPSVDVEPTVANAPQQVLEPINQSTMAPVLHYLHPASTVVSETANQAQAAAVSSAQAPLPPTARTSQRAAIQPLLEQFWALAEQHAQVTARAELLASLRPPSPQSLQSELLDDDEMIHDESFHTVGQHDASSLPATEYHEFGQEHIDTNELLAALDGVAQAHNSSYGGNFATTGWEDIKATLGHQSWHAGHAAEQSTDYYYYN